MVTTKQELPFIINLCFYKYFLCLNVLFVVERHSFDKTVIQFLKLYKCDPIEEPHVNKQFLALRYPLPPLVLSMTHNTSTTASLHFPNSFSQQQDV